MLRNVNDLMGHELRAEDGDIGKCKDFLFDDEHWTIRYMVADTGHWLPGRKVLISPISFGVPDWQSRMFPVRLTQQQIEDSPPLEEDAPVSRRYELEWFKHYNWPGYWAGPGPWGGGMDPAALYVAGMDESTPPQELPEPENPEDCHLRSVKEVEGYRIQARDDEIGHVEGFITEDVSWIIRYLIIDTRNLLPGKKVLIAPAWVSGVDWGERQVRVDLSTEDIKSSPKYEPGMTIDRKYEQDLYDFYRFPTYWP